MLKSTLKTVIYGLVGAFLMLLQPKTIDSMKGATIYEGSVKRWKDD